MQLTINKCVPYRTSQEDKANGNYKRSLNTGFSKLNLEIPRVRSGEFRSIFYIQNIRGMTKALKI